MNYGSLSVVTRKEVQQIKADLAARDAETIGPWGSEFLAGHGMVCKENLRKSQRLVESSMFNHFHSDFPIWSERTMFVHPQVQQRSTCRIVCNSSLMSRSILFLGPLRRRSCV